MSRSRSREPVTATPPRLAVTPGEPAGIGPELCVMAHAAMQDAAPALEAVYFADPALLQDRADRLGIAVTVRECRPGDYVHGAMNVSPVALRTQSAPGIPDTANGPYVIDTLQAALSACLSGETRAMVTGPVNKAVIANAGIPFSGHTEWLAERTGTPRVVMMLAGAGLRVALVTTHLPLAQVSAAITREGLASTIRILHSELVRKFAVQDPVILVCGLNPHAGEGGHLGSEEIDTIIPVIDSLVADGMKLEGPLPADTIFNPPLLQRADAVLAMYHDQGLPVLKHAAFGQAVNITLGLPVIRTSVDHGTAFDLAGTGRADTGSLISALNTAAELALLNQSLQPATEVQ